jgi:hypothetical protein
VGIGLNSFLLMREFSNPDVSGARLTYDTSSFLIQEGVTALGGAYLGLFVGSVLTAGEIEYDFAVQHLSKLSADIKYGVHHNWIPHY